MNKKCSNHCDMGNPMVKIILKNLEILHPTKPITLDNQGYGITRRLLYYHTGGARSNETTTSQAYTNFRGAMVMMVLYRD